jgi:hypothetical protein
MSSGSGPTTCAGANSGKGCCGADGNNYYCASGATTVTSKTCTNGQVCGWSATKGYYTCVAAPGGADPSGANPIACPGP